MYPLKWTRELRLLEALGSYCIFDYRRTPVGIRTPKGQPDPSSAVFEEVTAPAVSAHTVHTHRAGTYYCKGYFLMEEMGYGGKVKQKSEPLEG